MQHSPPPSAPTSGKPDIGFREFVLLCAALMAMNALSIDPMLPALPDIGRDLAIPHPNDRQMIISIYFMGVGVGSLLFGVLSDRFGRKPVMGVALALFAVCTVACAGAQSFTMLLIARALAGFFAGASRVITVGIVRDKFQGDAMARVMSLIFAIFMIVPVIAPSFGQAVLWVAPWRWIFWTLAILAALVTGWMMVRMTETLRPENRLPIDHRVVGQTIWHVVTHRLALGYMLASGVVIGGLIGFVLSVQQIFFDIFDAPRLFPLAFAAMAGCMGIGGLVNSRLVQRFGARRMSQTALVGLIVISIIHLGVTLANVETMLTFIILQSLTMLTVSFTASNFGSISMEPFAKGAGVASSFQSFLTTVISSALGATVGAAFNGTTVPLALGFLVFGVVALVIVAWAERGRLFTRPHHHALREPASETIH